MTDEEFKNLDEKENAEFLKRIEDELAFVLENIKDRKVYDFLQKSMISLHKRIKDYNDNH